MSEHTVQRAEEWRPIAGFEGRYEVSSCGRVRSQGACRPSYAGLIMKHWVQNKNYRYVSLRKCGRSKSYAVHRLVLEAFVGPRPEGKQVAHYDGDPSNNCVENLRWATAKENILDRTRHGRTVCGEDQHSAKLDKHVVKTIKKLKQSGLSGYEVARLACVNPSTIQAIWKGETWRHV